MVTTSSSIIGVTKMTATVEQPAGKFSCDYFFILMTRKVPSTTEKQLVLA